MINIFKLLVEHSRLLFVLFFLSTSGYHVSCQDLQKKPNIVFIMIDDLGYGDVGCYGSLNNLTPNIDRLAASGLKFIDYHSNGPMCTPTRAAFMSGMYQHRMGEKFERALSGKQEHDQGMPTEVITIAEVLKEAGYATGMFGKWHLGYTPPYLPFNQGFDDFKGLGAGDGDHHTHIDRWGREDWWQNGKLDMEEGYSSDLITNHSIQFIKKHQKSPFFLYVAHLAIHFPWQGPNDPAHRKPGTVYENDKWGIIPDKNNVQPHIKAMVESIDDGVGRIMKTIKELGLDKNTLVIFTSDNGGYTHYKDSHFNISSNGKLRGQKTEIYEGGHRVPFIARWPGKIEAGGVSNEIVMTMDMFPTFIELAQVEQSQKFNWDGRSILPVMLSERDLPERSVFWKMRDERAIRKGKWKLCLIGNQTPELYDLSIDIGETTNLAKQFTGKVKKMTKEYKKWENDVTSDYN